MARGTIEHDRMCTLVLLQRPGELLAVSGNRNELLSRPASGPSVLDGVLAPHDELAGGSWLGLNRHGLFVCVTNRRGGMVDPSRKSRGLLVIEALKAHSASGHADAVGYGTRSSLQLFVRPGSAEGLWTEGHPCVNEPRSLAPLISSLGIDTSR